MSTQRTTDIPVIVKTNGDFPVPCMAGWKTRPPVRETDKALKEILEKIGV